MAGKKKTKKRKQLKQSKKQRQQLEQVSEGEVRLLVEEMLVRGKPREALQVLQQLPFNDAVDFLLLKAEAYAWRAQQLEQKGLDKEAAAVLDLLRKQMTAIPAVDCQQLARVIAAAPAAFGVRYYQQHLKQHAECPWLENAVANQLVVSNQWHWLSDLPADNVVHRDGQLMARAAADLESGRWQEALVTLEPLPRKSPFAPWKLFAKAMLSAATGEEENLQKALKPLPPDFPLRQAVVILRQKGCAGFAELREQKSQPAQAATQALLRAMQSGDHTLPELIVRWTRQLFPHYGDMAIRSVAELVALQLAKQGFDIEDIEELLPRHFTEPICLRMEMFYQTPSDPGAPPFCMAHRYLDFVDEEFAGVAAREQFEAAIYFNLLSRILVARQTPRDLRPRDLACLQEWLKDYPVTERDLFVAAMDRITRLAPDTVAYHKLVQEFDLRELSREGKALLGQVLLRIQAHFPEDPFPYVQLARLYWSQNAHRKAQKTLEEAWKQAPYDLQVKEYYSLGLLRAAVMARKRRAYPLARKDLQAALELGVKELLPLGYAVQAGMDYLESGDGEAAVDALLALPDALLQLRAGICFYLDLMAIGRSARAMANKVKNRLHKQLRANLAHLSGAELMAILAPLNDAYASFFGPFNPVEFFSSLSPKIVAKLNDQEVLTIYAQLLGSETEEIQIKWVRKDLEDRLRKDPENIFLKFYVALIHYLLNPFVGPDRFEALMHGLDKNETQALRDFCRKIAPHFKDPLRTALNFLDFNALAEHDDWFEPDFEFVDEDDYEDEEDLFGSIEDMVNLFAAMGNDRATMEVSFEMLMSMLDMEGMDDEMLRGMGFMFQEKARTLVQKLRLIYSGKKAKRLGRSGRLILFPERD